MSGDADVVREALEAIRDGRRYEGNHDVVYDALDALDRLEALSRVHVTEASHDLLVAEGWLDPAQASELQRQLEWQRARGDEWRIKEMQAEARIADVLDAEIDRMTELWRDASRRDDYGRIVQCDAHLNGLKWARDALGGVRGGEEQRT